MDHQQEAERLRALWKSGRDKFQSFFTVLEGVRKNIGDEALPGWCLENLHVGMSVIVNLAATLRKDMAIQTKEDLAKAKKHEQDQRITAERQRALEKLEHAKQMAAEREEIARLNAEAKRVNAQAERRVRKQHSKDERGPRAAARRRKREVTQYLSDADLRDLAKRLRKAQDLCARGLDYWIEGSIAMALVLRAARDKCESNNAFHDWLDINAPDLEKNNRAALINLSDLGEKRLRGILRGTSSRSYETIWRNHQKLNEIKDIST